MTALVCVGVIVHVRASSLIINTFVSNCYIGEPDRRTMSDPSAASTAPAPTATASTAPDVATLAIKLPNFFTSQPRVWFTQAEAQFALRGVKADATKFYHAVSALDQNTAVRVLDILEHPPTDNKYEALKQRLIGSFSLSRAEKAKKLLQMPPQPDRKPTEILDEFLSILGSDYHPDCLFFEQLFRNQLAPELQLQLASAVFSDPRAFAEKADQLWAARGRSEICAIGNSFLRDKTRKHFSSRQPPHTDSGLCYYHQVFGDKAKKCRPPCKRASVNVVTETDSGNVEAGCQ